MSYAQPSWRRNISPYKLIDKILIGEGCFGRVYKATWIARDEDDNEFRKTVAIKVMKNASREQVFGERDRMSIPEHKNVVSLLGVVQQSPPDVPWLVMEYAENGDLLSNIRQWKQSGGIPAYTMLRISWNIAMGMEYLHDNRITHGDLAARNVLLNRNNVAKVGDLGYYDCQNADNYENYIGSEMPCPVRWMPPENLPRMLNSRRNLIPRTAKMSRSGDVWAFGVTMFELWSRGKLPFEGYDHNEVYTLLLNRKLPTHTFRIMMKREAKDLMHSCWQFDSSQRPSFQEIVQNFESNYGLYSNDESDDSEDSYENNDQVYDNGDFFEWRFGEYDDRDDDENYLY